MDNYVVYMHVNKANGKRYIGISINPLQRWANGKGYYRNKHFNDAINKYGWNNFDHLILYTDLSKKEACEIEQYLIAKYKTQNKKYGYNITSGGETFRHSEDSKALMSKNRKGKGLHEFSEEHKKRIREHHGGGAEKKPVVCIETGEVFSCIKEAANATGINKKQISNCCKMKPHYNTAGGYKWKFAEVI